jgi:hypothetical protein
MKILKFYMKKLFKLRKNQTGTTSVHSIISGKYGKTEEMAIIFLNPSYRKTSWNEATTLTLINH